MDQLLSPYDVDYDSLFPQMMEDTVQAGYLSVDTESTGLMVKDRRSHCIGISVAGRRRTPEREVFSHYFPVAHTTGNLSKSNIDILRDHLKSRTNKNPIIFHNAKFDLESLETVGIILDGFFYDTLGMARLVNENYPSYKLDWLSKFVLRREGKRKSVEWEHFMTLYGWDKADNFPPSVMGDYATGDTELTLYLFEHFFQTFVREGFNG